MVRHGECGRRGCLRSTRRLCHHCDGSVSRSRQHGNPRGGTRGPHGPDTDHCMRTGAVWACGPVFPTTRRLLPRRPCLVGFGRGPGADARSDGARLRRAARELADPLPGGGVAIPAELPGLAPRGRPRLADGNRERGVAVAARRGAERFGERGQRWSHPHFPRTEPDGFGAPLHGGSGRPCTDPRSMAGLAARGPDPAPSVAGRPNG